MFAAACFALTSAVSTHVLIVDASGGGSFTDIQSAVNAASIGDTILVKPGDYSPFFIHAKSLTVIGDVAGTVNISGNVTVRNLTANQVVTLARLKAHGNGATFEAARALYVDHCNGAVRVVDCDLTGRDGTATPQVNPGTAAYVHVSPNTAFAGCRLFGGDGISAFTCAGDYTTGGAMGLFTDSGRAAIYECAAQGGDGGDGGDLTGGGGAGLMLWNIDGFSPSFLFAARSNLRGGGGGDTSCPDFGCPNNGGPGFHIVPPFPSDDPDPSGWALDLTIDGGAAGIPIGGSGNAQCNPVGTGPAYSGGISPLVFSVPSVGFSIPSIAREGELVTVKFTSTPGAHVYLNDRTTTTFQPVESWRGVLLSPFPAASAATREIKWGVIPASGVLTRTYRVPPLQPGVQAQTRFFQAYRVGPNGITLGSFRTLTVLDSSL
jgi:hypothetical protein